MTVQNIQSYVQGAWIDPDDSARPITDAVTGKVIARAGTSSLDTQGMLDYGRRAGGPALRALTFHQRAKMLKNIAQYLNERKQELYELSFSTGATQSDHMFDIDGGIGTLFVFASKGRKELPDSDILIDGEIEPFGKTGSFVGQHVYTSLRGVAVHINAFNFPVWGMLEKLAPSLLAGVPSIVKPATATCHVTELCVRMMVESGFLPQGAVQLVTGGLGNTLDLVTCQDIVTFTGSAQTANLLRATPNLLQNSVRFTAEQDSLNASILGPDADSESAEFALFIKEIIREMTTKAGQKCTAVRRIFVPQNMQATAIDALTAKLSRVTIGNPRSESVRMGPLVSKTQKVDVLSKAKLIGTQATRVFGDPESFQVIDADRDSGAFVPAMLFHCADPDTADIIHSTEAFGPVSTVMGYRDMAHAIELANKGQGSLVASVFTHDPNAARTMVLEAAAYHGRLYFNNRDTGREATGHGAPMPHMVHGGPGRAGGGEELGGIRGVKHFMQRTAVQASPDILSGITQSWVPTGSKLPSDPHPFTQKFDALFIGQTLVTKTREITIDDIEHFAHFTGDTFYAHMDAEAAKRNPFFPDRVAHGYLLLSFAAGLFVEPNEGPVLANTGLDNLRFMKPVVAGDHLGVTLTVKSKKARNDEYGEVRWHVRLNNQDDDIVAEYELLTMVAK